MGQLCNCIAFIVCIISFVCIVSFVSTVCIVRIEIWSKLWLWVGWTYGWMGRSVNLGQVCFFWFGVEMPEKNVFSHQCLPCGAKNCKDKIKNLQNCSFPCRTMVLNIWCSTCRPFVLINYFNICILLWKMVPSGLDRSMYSSQSRFWPNFELGAVKFPWASSFFVDSVFIHPIGKLWFSLQKLSSDIVSVLAVAKENIARVRN